MSDSENLSGRQIGRYVVLRHLAAGGMADIYIARQEGVGGFEKDLALKVLKPRFSQQPRVVQMFIEEARLAARLNHQNIVHVYDVGDASGMHYIAMEYIHGETVADILRRGMAVDRYISLEHAIQVMTGTAVGLAYSHEAGIVHRDISPSNILVSYEGQTKIVDFGIARAEAEAADNDSAVRAGKIAYMSPEQARGEPLDARSDLFSLGIVFYEITLGRRLFRGQPRQVMKRILDESIPPPTYYKRDYPPALEQIVMRLLEKRPGDRFQSAAVLCQTLEQFLEEQRMRTSHLRLAQYLKELFAPELQVSADGVARARQFDQSEGAAAGEEVRDESEELDFDRRAPMRLRMTALEREAVSSGGPRGDSAPADVAELASGAIPPAGGIAGSGRSTGSRSLPTEASAGPPASPAPAVIRSDRDELRTLGVGGGRPAWLIPAIVAGLACAGAALFLLLR